MKTLIVVILWVLSPLAIASIPPYDANDDIHHACKKSPTLCLEKISKHLNNTSPKSRVWFEYKLYQMESLFQLVRMAELKEQTAPWVDRDDVPLKFKIKVYIYYAKAVWAEGQKERAHHYLNRAIETLSLVHQTLSDPMLVVQIANALNSLGEYQQGYDMLQALDKQYLKRNNALFKLELYENIGHFSLSLGKLNEHILYRKKSVFWAKLNSNQQRLAVAIYNLARAHQKIQAYPQAIEHFDQAEKIAHSVSDHYVVEMTKYRKVEMALERGYISQAKHYFQLIDVNVIGADFSAQLSEMLIKINQ